MTDTNRPAPVADYVYLDEVRPDIWRMIPKDGNVIGSIGCGTAKLEGELVKEGRQVHGVDISAEAVAIARERITSARVVAPEDRTYFADASLDGLILADVLEHLPQAWEALETFARAVRPGGWVVISVPNMRGIRVLQQLVIRGDWPEEPMGLFDRTHLQVMTFARLERWGRNAGLNVEEWFEFYLSGLRLGRAVKWFNILTFKLFNGFLHFECQARFRKI